MSMSKILLHRWKKGYEAFILQDYSAAFSMFELIEMTYYDKSSIPKEIIMNRILSLISLKNNAHPVEVGSKLLRSDLGSFFLFAIGLHQEKVDLEFSFTSFKKCLQSLGNSKAKQFPGSSWILTKFMVLINLAIISTNMGDTAAAESYIQKAEAFAIDEVSKKKIQQFQSLGFEGASCIGFPADVIIAPPGYKEEKDNARKLDAELKAATKPKVNESTVTEAATKPKHNESAVTEANSKPTVNESAVTEADSKPIENESAITEADSKPIENESAVTEADSKPIENESAVTEADSKPTVNESAVTSYADNLQALKNGLTKNEYETKIRSKMESMLPSPPVELTESENVPFYRYLKNASRSSKRASKSTASSPIEDDLGMGEFFRETAYVQIFGIWRPFAVCIDGKILRLCKENLRSQVDLEIQLDNCRIEPATNYSFRKLHLFKLVIYTDEYIFALGSLSTSLEWIAKIMKSSLAIPERKELKLLRTGLGREPISPISQ